MSRLVRLRRFAVALAAVACAATTAACTGGGGGTAAAAAPSPHLSGTYLALGDSVPFGYHAGGDPSKAGNFTGYPELVGKRYGVDVVNATCPGETTASFADVTAQSNGCENALHASAGYRTFYPLHTLYDSVNQSQLDFSLSTLKKKPDVSLVTLQIGANDAFLCQQTTTDSCVSEAGTVAQTVRTNVDSILSALRGQGEYHGRIVVVTYYALDYSGVLAASTRLLDSSIGAAARAHGATVADGYAAFRPAAVAAGGDPATAGLVVSGDVHPTAKGQELLAEAVEKAVTG